MANQKVDKKVETLTYCLLPVACSLKSSNIFATNKIGLLYVIEVAYQSVKVKLNLSEYDDACCG